MYQQNYQQNFQPASYGQYYPQGTYQVNANRTMNTNTSLGLKGRPVSSLDEVRATSIDFDGSTFYFPDVGNSKIYTKQINMDGTVSLKVYELAELPQTAQIQQTTLDNLVTKKEFEQAVNNLTARILSLSAAAPTQESAVTETAQEFAF